MNYLFLINKIKDKNNYSNNALKDIEGCKKMNKNPC